MPAKGTQGAALQGKTSSSKPSSSRDATEHGHCTRADELTADDYARDAVSNLNAPEAGLPCPVLSVASESTLSSAQHGVPPTPCTTETITANSSENSCGAPAKDEDEHAEPVHTAAGNAVLHQQGASTSHAAYLLSADASYASQGYESEDGIPTSSLQRLSHRAAGEDTRQTTACAMPG